MSWKIIQLEIECKFFVFLYPKTTPPFLAAFLRRKKKTKTNSPVCVCGGGNVIEGNDTCVVLFGKNTITLMEIFW